MPGVESEGGLKALGNEGVTEAYVFECGRM
jgi:hypothetical protein